MANIPNGTTPATLPPFTVSPEYQAQSAARAVALPTQPAQPTQPPVKPGWQTTEFWLHVAGVVGPIVLQILGQSQSAAAIAIAQAAPMLYTIARTYLKSRGIGGL